MHDIRDKYYTHVIMGEAHVTSNIFPFMYDSRTKLHGSSTVHSVPHIYCDSREKESTQIVMEAVHQHYTLHYDSCFPHMNIREKGCTQIMMEAVHVASDTFYTVTPVSHTYMIAERKRVLTLSWKRWPQSRRTELVEKSSSWQITHGSSSICRKSGV